jgi:UDP-glucose 4-epimerase
LLKKVLILGGFGFIGTNLAEELLKRGNYEIIIFEAKKVIIQNPDILNDVKVYYGDFHNEKDYEIIFKENKIDIVLHLIGTTIPSKSNQNIIYDIESNLKNTIKLLDIMKKYHVKNIVFLSSGGTVYGISKNKIKELDPTSPICSYGIMKLAVEKYLFLYNYLYGINFLILRPSNPFGEYHTSSQQGLINVILEKILNGEPIEIWGDGSVVRDYIYIKDFVRILVDLIEKDIQNEIINIGSGRGYSINEILTIIKKEIGNFPLEYVEARKVDVPYVVLNINKLRTFLEPNLMSIEKGIKKTYNWLKKI